MEPRFNVVPRDWENVFVIYRQDSLYRKPRFNDFLGKQAKCTFVISRCSEWLISTAQHFRIWTIPVINIFIRSYYCLSAVHSYGTRNTRIGKQNYLLLYTNFILFGRSFAFMFTYLSVTCWHSFVISRNILGLRSWIVFVGTRISLNRGSVPYILLLFWPGWILSFFISKAVIFYLLPFSNKDPEGISE